ncbi:MAG: enoyl-CoA hydratase/isomerase family protein [Bacteriovoracaceae bacterium]
MSLFNYSTINVKLEKATHTLYVSFNRPDDSQKINFEMLFELESVLAWAANKVEISTIFFTSTSDTFCQGLDETNLGEEPSKMEKVLTRVRKILEAIPHLPQVTICDLKKGASGVGAEFSLFCDLRIAHVDTLVSFNHHNIGVTPSCGGLSLLADLVGHSVSRHWIYTGRKVNANKLEQSGFISDLYSEENAETFLTSLLTDIDQGSGVARIQSKMAMAQLLTPGVETGLKVESKIAKANLYTYDWKEAIKAKKESREPNFMAAKSFTYVLDRAKNEMIEELKP